MSEVRRLAPRDEEPRVDVEAAGGVVLRSGLDGIEVLVVHRVRYDDWSLPKGKLDPGEDHVGAAVREVEEETGVRAVVVGPELSQLLYPVPEGTKRVRWFGMREQAGDPTARPADHEVDEACWLPVATASTLLTYAADVALLNEALDRHDAGGPP